MNQSYRYILLIGLLLKGCSNSMFENANPGTSSSSSVSGVKAYYGFGNNSTTYVNQLADSNQVIMPVENTGGIYYELLTPGEILESSLVKDSFTCSGTCTVDSVEVIKNDEGLVTGYIVFITNKNAEEVTLGSSGVLDSSGKNFEAEALTINFVGNAPSLSLTIHDEQDGALLMLTPPIGYLNQDMNITSEYYLCDNCVIKTISEKSPHEIGIEVLDISKVATVQVNENLFRNEQNMLSMKSNIVTVDLRANAVTAKVSVGIGSDYSKFFTFNNFSITTEYDINNPVTFLYDFSGPINRSLGLDDFSCTAACLVNSVIKMPDQNTYVVEVSNTDANQSINIGLSAEDVRSYKIDKDGKNEEISILIPSREGLLTRPLNSIFQVNKKVPKRK